MAAGAVDADAGRRGGDADAAQDEQDISETCAAKATSKGNIKNGRFGVRFFIPSSPFAGEGANQGSARHDFSFVVILRLRAE
jgi:hypothetical protein